MTASVFPTMSVPDAARAIGVTPARVYQRLSGKPRAGVPIIGSRVLDVSRKGKTPRTVLHVDVVTVLQWRAQRLDAGEPVGPVPSAYIEHDVPPPPARPTPNTEAVGMAVGMPTVRPF